MPSIGEVRRGREIGKKQEHFAFIWIACSVCGRERWVRLQKGQPDYECCIACAQKARGLKARGENNPHWNGGRSLSRGYVRVLDPRVEGSHYILEHRLVWEQTHGKPVPKGCVIHHLNGIKTDNRPENLAAVPKKGHEGYTYIHLLQARIREVEMIMENIKVQSKQGS